MIADDAPRFLVVEFAVSGTARFLSHAETLRVFQRALVRANVNMQYTCGFNPRPKLSLPLPRSVGLETDADLLCIRLDAAETTVDSGRLKQDLAAQMPQGFEVLSVEAESRRMTFQPQQVTYLLRLRPMSEYETKTLMSTACRLTESRTLNIRRWDGEPGGKSRMLDVRPFIESIKVEAPNVIVCCKVSGDGSIRVDEILGLLELDVSMLAAPVRRTAVKWEIITKHRQDNCQILQH